MAIVNEYQFLHVTILLCVAIGIMVIVYEVWCAMTNSMIMKVYNLYYSTVTAQQNNNLTILQSISIHIVESIKLYHPKLPT